MAAGSGTVEVYYNREHGTDMIQDYPQISVWFKSSAPVSRHGCPISTEAEPNLGYDDPEPDVLRWWVSFAGADANRQVIKCERFDFLIKL